MVQNEALVIGLEDNNRYRVLVYRYNPNTREWKFNKTIVTEEELIRAAAGNKIVLKNVEIAKVNNKLELRWTKGAKSRFDKTDNDTAYQYPLVIISEIRIKETNRLIGYRVCNRDGRIDTVRLMTAYQYAKIRKLRNPESIPFQNAIYNEKSEMRKDSIKGYVENQFIIEYVSIHKPTNVEKANVDIIENKKQISRLEELFNQDQIEQLKLGKKSGVNIRIYGNNKLTADKMLVIRKALEDGVDPRPFADPSFTADAMRAYSMALKTGVDIKDFINPKYTVTQIFELSTAWINGVDLKKLADPNKSANDIAKERIILETELWGKSVDAEDKPLR